MTIPSPIDHMWDLGSAAMALAVCNDSGTVLVGTAEGIAHKMRFDDNHAEQVELHQGSTLSFIRGFEPGSFIAGGDDGRLVRLDDQRITELAKHKGKWIEHLAVASKARQLFYAFGKELHRLREDGTSAGAPWVQPSTIGGIALHPQEKRLAVAQYNHVSVYPLNAKHAEPLKLPWGGAHIHCLWHPAGDIVVTTMQEAALHGWRLTDKAEMRMQGYESKVESIAFMEGGRYLASAGSRQIICWPFFGGGPWGKAPLTVGADTGGVATILAAHSKDPLLAVGYENGTLHLVPLYEGNPLPLLRESGDRISVLQWTGDGRQLYAGTEGGRFYRFTVESVSAVYGG